MISHPLDAPSNLSDSVSSIMRLLISNRIIAAGAGIKEREEIYSCWPKFTVLCQIQQFLSSLHWPDRFRRGYFRVLCPKDPKRRGCPLRCLRENHLSYQCVDVDKNKFLNTEFSFLVVILKKKVYLRLQTDFDDFKQSNKRTIKNLFATVTIKVS